MKSNYLSLKVKLIKCKRGEGNSLLPQIKRQYGDKGFKDAVTTILTNTNFRDYFFKELFPRTVEGIITEDCIPISFKDHEITERNIINEILCIISLMCCFDERIRTFDSLRKKYEKALFCGNYQEADDALEEVKTIFGFSFWYIESKMLTIQYNHNQIDANKFYQEAKKGTNNSFIKTYIRMLWRKTNIHESYKDSYSFICNKSRIINDDSIMPYFFKTYFAYNSVDFNMLSLNNKQVFCLLNAATYLNLIDMYILIDSIIVSILSNSSFGSDSKQQLILRISTLDYCFYCKKTCDLIMNQINYHDELTTKISRLKKLLGENNHNELEKIVSNDNSMYYYSFEFLHIISKIQIIHPSSLANSNSLGEEIINVLKDLYLKTCSYHEFVSIQEKINRLVLILFNSRMRFSFYSFVCENFYGYEFNHIQSIISSEYYNHNALKLYNTECDKHLFFSRFGNWESDWGHQITKNEDLLYDNTTKELYKKQCANIDSNCSISSYFEDFNDCVLPIVNSRIYEKLYRYYIKSSLIDLAISLYVDLQFRSKLLVASFDTNEIDNKCYGNQLRDLKDNFDFCLYAHITNFRNGEGFKFNHQVSKCVLAILKAKGIGFPSNIHIQDNATHLEKMKLAYFFRHICEPELLLSILSGYSINDDEQVIRYEKVYEERIKVLKISLELEESEKEKEEINYQIQKAEKEINNLKTYELEPYMVSSAKIFSNSIYVSDEDIIIPFYNNIQRIVENGKTDNLYDFTSGEFSLFKNPFIKYKKAFIHSLDNKIGVYIRHGFFKQEILGFFVSKEMAYKSCDSHSTNINEQKKEFSLKLHDVINTILDEIKMLSTSDINKRSINKIYLDNKTISNIASVSINSKNPYEFKEILNSSMVNILDQALINLGNYIQKRVYRLCKELILSLYPEEVVQNDKTILESLQELSERIEKWFCFIREGEELCYVEKYCKDLKINKKLNYHISEMFPSKISLYKLHYIDLILTNLIINAEEHSGLTENELVFSACLSLVDNKFKIYFKNNLSKEIDVEALRKTMDILEDTSNNKNGFDEADKGNGFYYIKNELNSLTGVTWSFAFCRDELPNSFALNYMIDWGNEFV